MTVGSLFSGIGGFDLGLERAGMEIKWQVEIDPFCNKILEKHWPNVRRYRDVKEVHGITTHAGQFAERQQGSRLDNESIICNSENIGAAQRNRFANMDKDGSLCPSCLEPVDLICGGFPCQPFSCAGKRKGKEDDRYLWPEMLRVISEIKPKWVIAENVGGFITISDGMEFEHCVSDLETEGYEVQAFIIPACAVNAPHRRDRVWIVANSRHGSRWSGRIQRPGENTGEMGQGASNHVKQSSQNVGNAKSRRQQEQWHTEPTGQTRPGIECSSWWSVEPDVGRVANGIPGRVDRLKSLGNAVVPQIVEIIGRAIMEIEASTLPQTRALSIS